MSVAATTAGEARFIRGRALVLLSGVLLSIGGPLIRLLESASEWQFLAYRAFALAVVLLMVIAVRYPGRCLATMAAVLESLDMLLDTDAGRHRKCADVIGFAALRRRDVIGETILPLSRWLGSLLAKMAQAHDDTVALLIGVNE